jgi:hypothetical protein
VRMEEEAAAIRAEIAALPGPRGVGRRYPVALRNRIVGYCHARRKHRVSMAKICLELGIGVPTLRLWTSSKREREASVGSAGFERLEIVNAPTCSPNERFVVRGPGGLCIEGLDIGALAELIRRLS